MSRIQEDDWFFFILSAEIEDAKKATENAALQSPPPASGTTPDYAAGLSATPTYAPATPQPTVAPTTGMSEFN